MRSWDASQIESELLSRDAPWGDLLVRTEAFEIRSIKMDEERTCILKCALKRTDHSQEALQRQFTALQEIEIKARTALRDSVPSPILIRDGLMAMSVVPGVPLNVLLRQRANVLTGWCNGHFFRQIGYSLGRWLTRFQSETASGNQPFLVRDYLLEFEQKLSPCRDQGISEAVLDSVHKTVKNLSSRYDGKEVSVAGCHGEFLPQNILVQGKHVGIVDFDTYGSARAIFYDPGVFLAYLSILARKPKYSHHAILSLAHGFLSGYKQELDSLLLRLHMLNALLRITTERKAGRLDRVERWELERALSAVTEDGFPPREQRSHSDLPG